MSWLYFGGAVALLVLLHIVDVDRLDRAHATAMKKQKTELVRACYKAQGITTEADNGLSQDYARIDNRAGALQLREPTACVPVTGKANASAGGAGHAGPDGVTAKALREYAARANKYRADRIRLEKFIDDERTLTQE